MAPLRPRSGLLAAGLAVAACGDGASPAPSPPATPTAAFAACGADLDCAGRVLVATLAQDPDTARALVETVPDPESRWMLVSRAIHADPAAGAGLCGALRDPSLRSRCQKDTSRPHLYAQAPRAATQPGQRDAPGPHASTLVLRPSTPSPFADTPADAGHCPDDGSRTTCATALAQERVVAGDARAAAAACRSIQSSVRWRSECALQAAETHARVRGPPEAGDTVALCLMAGEWTGRCVHKAHLTLALRAPPATADATGWQPALRTWTAMASAWASQPEALQTVVEDHYWSTVLLRAYRVAHHPTGAPLSILPETAHPHVRAAAAWITLRGRPVPSSLAEAVEAVEATLEQTTPEPDVPARADPHSAPRRDFWADDQGTEGTLPAVHYLGLSRRVLAPDLSDDLQVCVLEAAARSGERWRTLLEDGRSASSPLVVASAERLLLRSQRR